MRLPVGKNIPYLPARPISHCLLKPSFICRVRASWGYFKAMVHRDPISSLSDFEESIEHHVRNIPLFMQLSTVEPAILRFEMVADNGGCHIKPVLYTLVDYLYVPNKVTYDASSRGDF